jgi:hypothetical protein
MRLTRTFAVRFSLALATTAGVASFLGLGGVFSCSTYQTQRNVPIDCTAQKGYDFQVIDDFTSKSWYEVPDYVPAVPDAGDGGVSSTSKDPADANRIIASAIMDVTTIPDGPTCGNTNAGVFRGSHNNDWGGMFGSWAFAASVNDASEYDGISFWARAPGNVSKSFTFLLNDDNTTAPLATASPESSPDGGTASSRKGCRIYSMTDGGTSQSQSTGASNMTDPGTGTPITGSSNTRASYADECGNDYSVIVKNLSSEWQFFTIPWSEFLQNDTPNRVSPENQALPPDPNDLAKKTTVLTSRLRAIGIRMPKAAEFGLWVAKLDFYRKKVQ